MTVTSTFRLPEPWTAPEVVQDVITAGGLELHRSGLSTIAPDGEEICGAAAEPSTGATTRAWFELLERVSILDAIASPLASYSLRDRAGAEIGVVERSVVFPESPTPAAWRHARSSGVALHTSWAAACDHAIWELIERDRVLRAWYGETTPVRLDLAPMELPGPTSYDWRAYSFPAGAGPLAGAVEVVGVFGFPTDESSPFVVGYAGRDDRDGALASARREATQLLAFLWGEPILDEPPEPAPTAMFHLEAYQARGRHRLVRQWLEQGHGRYWLSSDTKAPEEPTYGFVDVTPAWLAGKFHVAKAIASMALPLVFGTSPASEHLPRALAFHPIP